MLQGKWAVPSGRGHLGAGLDTRPRLKDRSPSVAMQLLQAWPYRRWPPQSCWRRNSRLWDRVQRSKPGVAAGSQAWSNSFSCSWCLRPRLLPT